MNFSSIRLNGSVYIVSIEYTAHETQFQIQSENTKLFL